MKKLKRILALVGAASLALMYGSTLLFAFIDHSKSQGLLKASIATTILLPVLLYAITLVYKLVKKDPPN
ncbi:hypothetical protein M2454_000398 [Aequitasia blattaphilus]|uniref:Uncharacterized protein n=1 Tax=Aequitasia blattaphilus TaxID=2949332 RepID=A0ABT1E8K2_9FIRM|nr:hypothetical protein [Aequitasia blattaphilus]MCP1101211.1 hypothetical protein [Aequitasia blattaphilus]MCR8613851.1 hypothetical protein [Aequitasia blattaphilus]